MSNAYGITFVGDDVLPPGHDFAFVVTPEGAWIFYRESALSPKSLEDSWSAYRALLSVDEPPDPEGESELAGVVAADVVDDARVPDWSWWWPGRTEADSRIGWFGLVG